MSGKRRYCSEVLGELLAMSAASIYRYLAAAKARGALRGVSTTVNAARIWGQYCRLKTGPPTIMEGVRPGLIADRLCAGHP